MKRGNFRSWRYFSDYTQECDWERVIWLKSNSSGPGNVLVLGNNERGFTRSAWIVQNSLE